MTLLISRLVIDFGLVVLIWMTQLIVYPAFVQFEAAALKQWHPRYNRMITVIVAPLMFAQLGLVGLELFQSPTVFTWASLVLVGLAWVLTFLQAVPLHRKIANGVNIRTSAERLVRLNWSRTVVWTAIFLVSLIQFLFRSNYS